MRAGLGSVTRRRFISLVGAGAAALTASPALVAAANRRGPTGDPWISPLLLEAGPFGRSATLRVVTQAILASGGSCPDQWHPLAYWEQIGHCLEGLDEGALATVFDRYFEQVLHGSDHAAFALELALAGRSSGPPPSKDEIAEVSSYLFATPSTAYELVPSDWHEAGVERFDLMLDVDEFRARPQTGPEYNGAMVAAASGMHYAAFVLKLRFLAPLIRQVRAEVSVVPAANIGDALCELLLGGIQVIAYQDDLGRQPGGVLLMARLMRRGYLIFGRKADGTVVGTQLEWRGLG